MSAPKSRPKLCFAIGTSLWKESAGHNAFSSKISLPRGSNISLQARGRRLK
jgi:hypothetical protein